MYYPTGWPRILKFPQEDVGEIKKVLCNRDKILTAILTTDSLLIWYVKPCVPIIAHRRTTQSIDEIGENVTAHWRPDSSMIAVVTEFGHLIIYHLVVPTDVKTLYEQIDSPVASLRRETDELFMKELIPPLIFSLAFEVEVEGGISDVVAIREQMMIATKNGKILRYSWDGQEIRDYTLDLRRIPFCVDQQVLKAVPLSDKGSYVSKIEYSPLIGGYAIVLNDGRAAFLVASTIDFDPNSVTGIWALQLEDATCIALNHKYKLIAFGRKNAQGVVYAIDELTGGLAISHKLILPSRDYPGCPGAVTCLRWTPDGTTLAMAWGKGGFSVWSTFGAMIMCSLCWDYGSAISDPGKQNPLCLNSLDWSAEGYQLWMVNSNGSTENDEDPEFRPFPLDETPADRAERPTNPFLNKALVLSFVKSPVSVNPCMSKQEHIYLQGEDRLYINLGSSAHVSPNPVDDFDDDDDVFTDPSKPVLSLDSMSAGSKHWSTVGIPHNYIGSSWPIRYTAVDNGCERIAVAGRTGFAHYSVVHRKWRLFGNETQEKDFIVTGGIIWWNSFVIMGCYNLATLQDEIRMYPSFEKLDNNYAKIHKVDSQVLLLNLLGDSLVIFCADSSILIFELSLIGSGKPQCSLKRLRSLDAGRIPGLNFHPACVILVALSHLRTETSRTGYRDSVPRETGVPGRDEYPSIILNVCGKVVMLQLELKEGKDSPHMTLPTILASCCETIWFPRRVNPDKPHLTASLWLYCGSHGMRVWLPVFPREGDHGHTFMSKRIMLHFPLEKFYPLAILFEDAIVLGTENDTILFNCGNSSVLSLPYCTLERTSLLFLHPILRQLIRRNLGYHAWEIARTCMTLPYFQHSLELLLHEVLEEEATSTDPIPDALLPSVVDFIQEFPVYHKTIGRCARKTEVALWPHLFAVVGSPRALFMECLNRNDLETAASYLLIIQNLEPPAVSQNLATLLLDGALDNADWNLAKELVRFLRSIDPEDVEEASQRPIAMVYGIPPQTPPIGTAPEEEISLLLGTLQVPRGRTSSVTHPAPKISPKDAAHRELSRSNSEVKAQSHRTRKISSDSKKDQTAEEFFIDVILQRHARKLLVGCRLHDLGNFAAHLDFQLVSWLKKEQLRAARVESWVTALKKIHADFAWPYPLLLQTVVANIPRKYSNGASSSGVASLPRASNQSLEDNLHALKIDTKPDPKGNGVSDSGYVSFPPQEGTSKEAGGDHNLLSEQTINAMLRPNSFRDDFSIMSEDMSVMSPEDHLDSPSSNWSSVPSTGELDLMQQVSTKGPHKSEVQLRYLLQLIMEANCLEVASLIAVVLKDALALIRIVNVARTTPDNKAMVAKLYQGFRALEAWAHSDCHGYAPFFNTIQPQINSLKSYLMQFTKDQKLTHSSTHSSLTSTKSLPPLPPNRKLSLGSSPPSALRSTTVAKASLEQPASLPAKPVVDRTDSVPSLHEGIEEQPGCILA